MPRLTFTDYTSTSPRGIDSIPTFSFSANHNINIGQLNHFKNLPRTMKNWRIVFGVACLMWFHNKITINSITERKSSNRDTVSIQNIFKNIEIKPVIEVGIELVPFPTPESDELRVWIVSTSDGNLDLASSNCLNNKIKLFLWFIPVI